MTPRTRYSRLRKRRRPTRSSSPTSERAETPSSGNHPAKLPLFLQNLEVSRSGDSVETEADQLSERILAPGQGTGGESASRSGGDAESIETSAPNPLVPGQNGRPLSPSVQTEAEQGLGVDLKGVRLHEGPDAAEAAALLGARAFTLGNHVWLGAGQRESDRNLMAHELAHVYQARDLVALRSATWLERRAWLGFFSHYLPRKFLNNYMDDTGTPITLTAQEMADVNPRVNLKASRGFLSELAALQKQAASYAAAGAPVPAIKYIEVSGPGQAMTNGTLGNFTIYYKGMLTVNGDGTWTFVGTMRFYDYWDFDPKGAGSGRSVAGEVKTRVGAYFLPGQPFEINSEEVALFQADTDARVTWSGGTPKFVNDRAGTAGADVAVGGVGGDAAGGEVGGGAGAEVGAQGAEDINK